MEDARSRHSSIPLVSRLDHLDFIMKYLEGKQDLPKWGGSSNSIRGGRPCLPLDAAVTEACFKGSLLDRVAALENRLFQLCLELESSSTSSTSTGVSGESSSQGIKREPSFPLPIFNHPIQGLTQHSQVNESEIQETSEREQQRKKNTVRMSKKPKEKNINKSNTDEKSCESGKKKKKKRAPPMWPHFKLLGC